MGRTIGAGSGKLCRLCDWISRHQHSDKIWGKQIRFLVIDPVIDKVGIHPHNGMKRLMYLNCLQECYHGSRKIASMSYEKDAYGKQIPVLTFGNNLTPEENGDMHRDIYLEAKSAQL